MFSKWIRTKSSSLSVSNRLSDTSGSQCNEAQSVVRFEDPPSSLHKIQEGYENTSSLDLLSGNNSASIQNTIPTDTRYDQSVSNCSTLPGAGNFILRDLLGALNVACVPSEARIVALKNLLRELTEQPLPDYDFELFHGAVNIVYQKLAVALCFNPTDEELRLSCGVIEKLHIASPKAIESAYTDIGYESLPLLIHVLQLPFLENYHTDDGQSRRRIAINRGIKIITHSDPNMQTGRRASESLKDAVQSACIILVSYSSTGHGKSSMAFVPGLLLSLVWIMDKFHNMPNTARCAAIATVSCLSELLENQEAMLKVPKLLHGIKRMTSTDENEFIQMNASIALRNLETEHNISSKTPSLSEDRHSPMVKELSLESISKTTLPPSFDDALKCDDERNLQSVIPCADNHAADSEMPASQPAVQQLSRVSLQQFTSDSHQQMFSSQHSIDRRENTPLVYFPSTRALGSQRPLSRVLPEMSQRALSTRSTISDVTDLGPSDYGQELKDVKAEPFRNEYQPHDVSAQGTKLNSPSRSRLPPRFPRISGSFA